MIEVINEIRTEIERLSRRLDELERQLAERQTEIPAGDAIDVVAADNAADAIVVEAVVEPVAAETVAADAIDIDMVVEPFVELDVKPAAAAETEPAAIEPAVVAETEPAAIEPAVVAEIETEPAVAETEPAATIEPESPAEPAPAEPVVLDLAIDIEPGDRTPMPELRSFQWMIDIPGSEVVNMISGISLNDRVLFINTLFREDPNLFQSTIKTLNEMDGMADAVAYLINKFPEWNLNSEVVYRFMMAARRKLK